MVTPEVEGLVGIVWLKDEREVRKSTADRPGWRFRRWQFVSPGPSTQEKEDHRDHLRAVAMEGQGCVRVVVREEARVNGDVHGGHASCCSGVRAFRFLIGLVICFARSRRCCAAARLLVTCAIVPRRAGGVERRRRPTPLRVRSGPVCFAFKDIEFVEEAYELKGREQPESTAMLLVP
jgi:hypothetical protein